VLALSLSLFTYLFREQIIHTLFGKEYAGSADAIKYLIWASIPAFWGNVWTTWLISLNKQYVVTIFQVISMLINVIMNFILIPRYGYVGASIATLISYASGQTLALIIYKPKASLNLLLDSIYPFKLK
jgi:O-antigen/teichoic acid export membrane protein